MNQVRSIEKIARELPDGRAISSSNGRRGHAIPAWLTAVVATLRRLPNGARPHQSAAMPGIANAPPGRRNCQETGRCAPGWDRCGTERCHFLPMSHAHCGRCGAACRPDQLCSNGRCT